jgi:hypothetical protein
VIPPAGAINFSHGSIKCNVIDLNGDGRLDMLIDLQMTWRELNPSYGLPVNTPTMLPPDPDDTPEFFDLQSVRKEAYLNLGQEALLDHGSVWQYSPEYLPYIYIYCLATNVSCLM